MERKGQQKSCIHRKQGKVPIGPDDAERAAVQRRLGLIKVIAGKIIVGV